MIFEFIEQWLPVVSLIASIFAVFYTLKKQSSEVNNLDADTIFKLHQSLKESDARYKSIQKEFEEYKRAINTQVEYLQSEVAKYRIWAEKLSKQLRDNNITPIDL